MLLLISNVIVFRCIYLPYYIFHTFQVGVGMSMEGIEQNPIVYDLMSEMAFRWDRVDVKVIILWKIRQLMLQLLFTQSFKPQIVTFKASLVCNCNLFLFASRHGSMRMPKDDMGNWFHQFKRPGTSYIIHYIIALTD